MMPPKFHDAAKQTSNPATQQQDAEARVAAKLALLTGARSAIEEGAANGEGGAASGDGSGAEEAGWVPPSGQSGDGRTALNQRFGY